MNKQEYMEQLKKRLRRLPKEDFERAVEYFEEYFAEAGAMHEAEAIEDLGSPREAAEQIIRDMALDYSEEPVKNVKGGFHGLWVAFLALCAAPLALPLMLAGVCVAASVLIAVLAVLFAILVVGACSVLAGPVTLIAGFTVAWKSIPVFITCVGLGFMFTGLGAMLTYGMYQLCRKFLSWSLRTFARMLRGGRKA